MKWDDLAIILAVGRGGSLSAAARRLGVDQTTVSRRLASVESGLATQLFTRLGKQLTATEAGEKAITHAERVEAEVLALSESLSGRDERPTGRVRVTAVPSLINRLLIPLADVLLSRHPGLELELIGEAGNLSLSHREADIALRLARPKSGTALCRRIGSIGYSCYLAKGLVPAQAPWVTYDEALAELPQAQWIAKQPGGRHTQLRVHDVESLLQALKAGLGRSLLPDFIGQQEPGLKACGGGTPVLTRDVWMLTHPDQRRLARIATTSDWLRQTLATISAG